VEIAKIAVIFLLAQWFSTEQKNSFVRYFPPFVVMALFALLILMQKDFSSTVVFVGLCLSMFVAGGMSIGILLLVCGAIAVPTVIALFTMPYRIRRIASFLMPDLDTNGANYQVSNAIKAIEKGGLFGVGLGKGVAKQGILPEVQNDFIFASMFEELGLIWMLFLVALFVMFAILGYKTFVRASRRDPFLGYLDFGMTTMVVWQAIINIAVVTGLLPPTGIPLPFFSQGGTNIFVVLVCCAVMYRIMLISSGRQPLEKSHLRKDQKKIVEFPSTAS
jgi:cell division protein FtsW